MRSQTHCQMITASTTMSKSFQDLAGQEFGKLTVIKRAPSDKRGQTMWECRCICGKTTIVRASSLRIGTTKSCGSEACRDRRSNAIDLTGMRFGRLFVENRAQNDKHGCAMWNCICDCGKRVVVKGSCMRRGEIKSCGCLGKGIKNDLTGEKFGRLQVIARVDNRGKIVRYLCRCDCGNSKVVDYNNLVKGTTTSCGCLRRELNHKKGEVLRDCSPAAKMREAYIQNFGPIPEGMYVTALDGDMKNCDVSNIALISDRVYLGLWRNGMTYHENGELYKTAIQAQLLMNKCNDIESSRKSSD